jgi:hypothetical protein
MRELVCYCFEHSQKDIENDVRKHGRSLIMENIQAEKKLGNCQCTVKNPKGK